MGLYATALPKESYVIKVALNHMAHFFSWLVNNNGSSQRTDN